MPTEEQKGTGKKSEKTKEQKRKEKEAKQAAREQRKKEKKEELATEQERLARQYHIPLNQIIDEGKIKDNVEKNLDYFIKKCREKYNNNISQGTMAELLCMSPPSFSRVINGDAEPTVSLLYNIKKILGYSADEFLYTNIEMTEGIVNGADDEHVLVAREMGFSTLYQLYYFDTSYGGIEGNSSGDAIKSGIMWVEKGANPQKYKVYAILNVTKKNADKYYAEASKGRDNFIATHEEDPLIQYYYGELDIFNRHVHVNLRLNLKNGGIRDSIQMIFHWPDSNNKQYIGGLGAMVSVSKEGKVSSPCVGYIAISNISLAVASEEIASHLLMHYQNVESLGSLDKAINHAIALYDSDYSRLSDENKKVLFKNKVDEIVKDLIEKKIFRTVVVSPKVDGEFYYYLKANGANGNPRKREVV